MKKQSFVAGAAILMIANAFSKILGALFKIPLTYILQEEGMAIYNSAFQIYILFLSFIISGIPFAISKLVSEYTALKDKKMVLSVVHTSRNMLLTLGLLGSIILYLGADFFAIAMKEEKAGFAVKMISPSVFLVAWGCVYKNYFQGVSNMVPTAISQVVESLVKLIAGYALAIYFIGYGAKFSAGGASLGVTVGELVATLILFFMYIISRDKEKSTEKTNALELILQIAFPILIASVISSMLSVIDTSMLRKRLIDFGNTSEEARFLYGAYTGYALTVFHLPVGILASFGVSILPVISGSVATKNYVRTQRTANTALLINIVLSLPCAVGIFFFADDALKILFNNTSSSLMLQMTAPCVVFLCVSQICSSIIQACGKITLSFICGTATMIIKITLSFILVKQYSIYGAIISANIAYFIDMLLNLTVMKHLTGLKLNIVDIIIKPSVAAVFMAFSIYLIKEPISVIFNNLYIRTFISGLFAVAVYALVLMLSGGVSVKEIRKSLAK